MQGLVRRAEFRNVEIKDVYHDFSELQRREAKMKIALAAVVSINLIMLCGFITLLTLLYKE